MNDNLQGEFLRKRMVELREKNGKSQSDMAKLIACNKSTISRVESGESSYKTILATAKDYCEKLGLTPAQTELFLRGDKAVVTDTSALLKNTQLLDELSNEYSKVVVPNIVVNEIDYIKDHDRGDLASKAWQILKQIDGNTNVITRNYSGEADPEMSNDSKIIEIAKAVSEEFN